MPLCQSENPYQRKGGQQVNPSGKQKGLKGQVILGIHPAGRRGEVQHAGHGAGQASALQHHHHFIAVGGQGAAHGAGQHDAPQNRHRSHAVSLRCLDFTCAGFADGACQHLGGVGRSVQAKGEQRAKKRFFEIGPGPEFVPARLNPFQLAQAVIDQVHLN